MSNVNGAEEEFTILIAEDDPDDQYLFSCACQDITSQVKICTVQTGRQLIQNLLDMAVYGRHAGVRLPSLIIADLKKPFLELEIIKEIRVYAQFKTIPIYIFSMDGSEVMQKKSIEAGAEGFFKKPSTYFDLKTIMRTILSKRK